MTLPVTYRRIVVIALPVIASNVLLPLQGLIDTAIMAHRPDPAFPAALSLAVSLFSLLYSSCNFLQYATSGLAAQALGRRDWTGLRAILWRSGFLAGVLAVILVALQTPLLAGAKWFYHPSPSTAPLMAEYTHYRLYGAWAELGNYCLLGWFAGQSLTRQILYWQIALTGCNVVASLLLANVLHWDLVGVALGTVLAHYFALALGLFLVWRVQQSRQQILFAWQRAWFSPAALRPLLGLNRDLFVRALMLMLCFAWFQRLGSTLGDNILAINGILLGLLFINAFALDGVAVAAEGLTGQALGQKQPHLLRAVVRKTALTTAILALLMTCVFYFGGDFYARLMTNNDEILQLWGQFHGWAIGLPLVTASGYLLDGFYFGAMAAATLRNQMLILAAISIPLATILTHFCGNNGIWAGIYSFFLWRAGLLAWHLPRILPLTGRARA